MDGQAVQRAFHGDDAMIPEDACGDEDGKAIVAFGGAADDNVDHDDGENVSVQNENLPDSATSLPSTPPCKGSVPQRNVPSSQSADANGVHDPEDDGATPKHARRLSYTGEVVIENDKACNLATPRKRLRDVARQCLKHGSEEDDQRRKRAKTVSTVEELEVKYGRKHGIFPVVARRAARKVKRISKAIVNDLTPGNDAASRAVKSQQELHTASCRLLGVCRDLSRSLKDMSLVMERSIVNKYE